MVGRYWLLFVDKVRSRPRASTTISRVLVDDGPVQRALMGVLRRWILRSSKGVYARNETPKEWSSSVRDGSLESRIPKGGPQGLPASLNTTYHIRLR